MKEYLRAFVIGSSFLAVLPFFIRVSTLKNKNYSYEQYTFLAPLYLGLMNMLSLYLSKIFRLTNRERYLLIGFISPIIVITISYIFETYTFTLKEWIIYSIRLIINHQLLFNIVIYLLNLYI